MFVALVAAACGSAGAPNSYGDQLRDFTNEDGSVEERSTTETNYRAGCETAGEAAELDNAADYCKCTYDVFASSVPFEVFQEYDSRVSTGIENGTVTTTEDLYEEFQEAYDGVEVEEDRRADIDAFRAEMKELEDGNPDTRALEELLASCN